MTLPKQDTFWPYIKQLTSLLALYGVILMANEKNREKSQDSSKEEGAARTRGRVKFEVYGEEMVEKQVKLSGNSGRVYLPPDWVGSLVKIIRID
jgi:putative transposon-encoded protein